MHLKGLSVSIKVKNSEVDLWNDVTYGLQTILDHKVHVILMCLIIVFIYLHTLFKLMYTYHKMYIFISIV